MENPATWTPLHKEIHKAAYHSSLDQATAILAVFHKHNYKITLPQVQSVLNKFAEQMRLQMCGLSLPAMMVNELAKEENR